MEAGGLVSRRLPLDTLPALPSGLTGKAETGAAAITRHRSLLVERRNARRPRRNVPRNTVGMPEYLRFLGLETCADMKDDDAIGADHKPIATDWNNGALALLARRTPCPSRKNSFWGIRESDQSPPSPPASVTSSKLQCLAKGIVTTGRALQPQPGYKAKSISGGVIFQGKTSKSGRLFIVEHKHDVDIHERIPAGQVPA